MTGCWMVTQVKAAAKEVGPFCPSATPARQSVASFGGSDQKLTVPRKEIKSLAMSILGEWGRESASQERDGGDGGSP